MLKPITIWCSLLAMVMQQGCQNTPENPQGQWLEAEPSRQLHAIEKQLRGFDMAMVETDYRYHELYWAGQDENWDYATYQADKIKLALENGLQRRPRRAQSAQQFLTQSLPEMQQAIATQDTVVFNKAFASLTASCNSCHAMEKVPFFTVKKPADRHSSIRK